MDQFNEEKLCVSGALKCAASINFVALSTCSYVIAHSKRSLHSTVVARQGICCFFCFCFCFRHDNRVRISLRTTNYSENDLKRKFPAKRHLNVSDTIETDVSPVTGWSFVNAFRDALRILETHS